MAWRSDSMVRSERYMSTSPTLRSAFLIMLLNMFQPMTTRAKIPSDTATTAIAAMARIRFLRRDDQVSAAKYRILFIAVHTPILVPDYAPVFHGYDPLTEGVDDDRTSTRLISCLSS